jgi:hypothetical protein
MLRQKVPSLARVAAGDRGFFTFIHVRERPERYGASSLFDTMPFSPLATL